MGATAALQHAALAARALSFAPRVDLSLSHGSFVPAPVRTACVTAIAQAVASAARESVAVHVGTGNHVDMAQVESVPAAASVDVVSHETFHHNVPAYLEAMGELVPLLKAEALRVLAGSLRNERF